ncbi:MAG: hypothetical protein ACIAXF_10200 [Phycisphaerales bacterium JB063]
MKFQIAIVFLLFLASCTSHDVQLQSRLDESKAWVSDSSAERMEGALRDSYQEWIDDVQNTTVESLAEIEPAGVLLDYHELDSGDQWVVSGFYITSIPSVKSFSLRIDGEEFLVHRSERAIQGSAKDADRFIFYPLWEVIEPDSELGVALGAASAMEIRLHGADGHSSSYVPVHFDSE